VIGDCHTAALISAEGAIDWYCPTRFDSPAVFCRLLDADKGGYLSLAPPGAFATRRRYLPETNVLETTFASAGGRIRVTDFMPVYARQPERRGYDVGTSRRIMRLIEGLDGCAGSRPVRVGNVAANQRQLDVYGEVLAAAYLHFHCQGSTRRALVPNTMVAENEPLTRDMWRLLSGLVDRAAASWQEPGQGIWEVRGGRLRIPHGRPPART
jgi:GH15 family glucan-1,4-alpha-glucosidase